MKRATVITVSLVLLALSWLALDDITTGSEPSYGLEWSMVVMTLIWFAAWAVHRLRTV